MKSLKKELRILNLIFIMCLSKKLQLKSTRMSRIIELAFVTKQETIVLPRAEPIVAKGVHVAVRIKYSEPIFNQ